MAMPKERSNHLDEIVEAISLLKNAESAWPEGFSNPLLKEVLQITERELKEKLFNIVNKKKDSKKKRIPKGLFAGIGSRNSRIWLCHAASGPRV
jgi:hypothetical protein